MRQAAIRAWRIFEQGGASVSRRLPIILAVASLMTGAAVIGAIIASGGAGSRTVEWAGYVPAGRASGATGAGWGAVYRYVPADDCLIPLASPPASGRARYWEAMRSFWGDWPQGDAAGAADLRRVWLEEGGILNIYLTSADAGWDSAGVLTGLRASLAQFPEVMAARLWVEDSDFGAPERREVPCRPAPRLTFSVRLDGAARPYLAVIADEAAGGAAPRGEAAVEDALARIARAAEQSGERSAFPADVLRAATVSFAGGKATVTLPGGGAARPLLRERPAAALCDCLALTLAGAEGVATLTVAAARRSGARVLAEAAVGEVRPAPLPAQAADGGALAAPGLRLAVMGDISLGRRIARFIEDNGLDYPLSPMRHYIRQADLAIANCEAALSDRGAPIPDKGIWLRGSPASAPALTWGGIDVVTLANNHILDYDSPALLQTMDVLRANGLPFAGAGADIAAARRPAYVEAAGLRVAVLAYSEFADLFWSYRYPRSFTATSDLPGVAPLRAPEVVDDIAAAAAEADIVVAVLHWGVEESLAPTPGQRELARQMCAAGADVVVGTHPHVLQGVEAFARGGGDGGAGGGAGGATGGAPGRQPGRSVVFYSLGNFVYDQYKDPNVRTVLALVELGRDGARRVEFIPARVEMGRPCPVTGDAAAVVLGDMERYSSQLGTYLQVGAGRAALDAGAAGR